MHRSSCLKLLDDYQKNYPDDFQVEKIRDFVKGNENCFLRTKVEGHMTASVWLLDRSQKRVLLTQHKKLNRWLQLGGHADGECNLVQVALQEAQEESGIQNLKFLSQIPFDVDVHLIPANSQEKEHYHYDLRFLLQVETNQEFQVSDESHALQWFSYDEIFQEMTDESILRMAKKLYK